MVNNSEPIMRYRNRAEELRAIAQETKDPKVRNELEKWANEYDLMADEIQAKNANYARSDFKP